MIGIRKSTDAGLTNAERKSLRESEAQEAMSDHDDAEKAFHENRERLRKARLAREATAGPMFYPAPDLPDRAGAARCSADRTRPAGRSRHGRDRSRPRSDETAKSGALSRVTRVNLCSARG
jgi:hypothetical protein